MRDPADMTDYRHLEHKPALYHCEYTTRDKDKDEGTGTVHSLYIVSSLSLEEAGHAADRREFRDTMIRLISAGLSAKDLVLLKENGLI